MRLTKLAHACVRVEKDGGTVVIDPSAWAGPQAYEGASAVLITHEHFDHFDPEGLRAALDSNPGLELWAAPPVAALFENAGGRAHAVTHGDTFQAAGFDVHVYGQQHAVLHRDIPVIPNTGFMVDTVFHPGDALTVPEDPVDTLLLPVSGPWLKMGEMVDYARDVAPRRGYAIHDALWSDTGLMVLDNFLKMSGDSFVRVPPGTTVEL
ncbi:MAG TPA: MBL fold metallo-hydrolase [Streptosporangiaceae bacterium]|nr:MBL fold metallo-hydrolase [Streptosporangiaceae bacterium]